MGELRGRGDQPSEEPDKPTDADQAGPPDPSWNTTKEGNKVWRVIRAADDRFAMPGESGTDKSRSLEYEKPSPDDRPAERPPSGEDLVETEIDDATLTDKLEKRLLEKETLGDLHDVTDQTGKEALDLISGRPPTHSEVCVPVPDKAHWTPGPGLDGGELLTGMLVVGIAVGEGVKRAYRARHAEKEG